MKKRNIIIISIVFILIITIFTVKISIQNENKPISFTDLKTQYNYIETSSKPSIIIFSFDADCCENTKKFFNEYNSIAKKLMKNYEGPFDYNEVKKILDEVIK